MHNSKLAWFKTIIFIILLIFINNILIYIISPVNNISRNTILDMYSEKNNIDMVFAGSSYSRRIDPYIMDKELDCNTFNYGFNGQIYIGTYYCLKELFKYHKPKTIVVSTDLNSYIDKEENPKSYMAIISSLKSITNKLEFYFNSANDGSYLNRLLIWPEYHLDSLKDIPSNIKKKNEKSYIDYPDENQSQIYKESYENKKSGYMGKGFLKIDVSNPKNVLKDNKLGKMVIKNTNLNDIKEKNIKYFKKIVDLCKENSAEVIFLQAPIPTHSIFSEKNYFKFDEEISRISKENGVDYYNFNLIKPELFKSKTEYFQDKFHLNATGSEVFSKSFAEFLKLRSSGEDMSKYFYTSEEYFDTINYINNTWFTWKMDKDKIDIKADSFYGNNIKPEYQFILIDSKTGKKEVIRDYDTNPNFTLKKPKLSTYKIRVNAREVGNNVEFSRYYEEGFGKK
ncbi:hypothetical protein [Clostridium botulinum]|uniref:hypothetical protein n=1 Tax=Clostridium botulinum TaxID=1491 RepID=UPI000773BA25|nr:hypothetical protein [Clostridium botulinum]MBY6929458.1 hypothetical protein [Clostridium botulinum]NFG19722.1 hypothetical protein [Clostridium botulinum]NFO80450.1 hypothetical protein [Clostridium botulinum]